MTRTPSPYRRLPTSKWENKTRQLVEKHPLDRQELVEVTLACWDAIFKSRIGPTGFRIGRDIFPRPQIMGFLLHELIPLEFSTRYPKVWRRDQSGSDKDLVYIPDHAFSVEIKTSSHARQIFGNRSVAQKAQSSKKEKSGYYLAVNFESFRAQAARPRVRRIRFGWLDAGDWVGQRAPTGQQARLDPQTERRKLLTLHEVK